ncbi:MAG: EamA family transporter [Pseudonocardia sp.]
MGHLLAVLALLLFSANVFAVRAASARLTQQLGFLVALLANVLFGAVLFVVDLLTRSTDFVFNPSAFWVFALAGVFASYLGRRGFFQSVETIGPSRASAIQITNPVFAAVLAWIWLGETLGLADVVLITLVLVGLYLTTGKPSTRSGARALALSGRGGLPLALLWPALLSAVAYAAGNVLRAQAIDTWREPVLGGLVGALAGTIAFAAFHVPMGQLLGRLRSADLPGILLWILTGLLTISAQIAVIAATAYSPVAIVLVISSSLPIVVIPVSILVLRNAEGIDVATVVGAGMVLAGVTGMLLR